MYFLHTHPEHIPGLAIDDILKISIWSNGRKSGFPRWKVARRVVRKQHGFSNLDFGGIIHHPRKERIDDIAGIDIPGVAVKNAEELCR